MTVDGATLARGNQILAITAACVCHVQVVLAFTSACVRIRDLVGVATEAANAAALFYRQEFTGTNGAHVCVAALFASGEGGRALFALACIEIKTRLAFFAAVRCVASPG